jgi:transposase InsO family protein
VTADPKTVIPHQGAVDITVQIGNAKAELTFLVSSAIAYDVILGRPAFTQLQIKIQPFHPPRAENVHVITIDDKTPANPEIEKLIEEFTQTFSNKPGQTEAFKHTIPLQHAGPPIAVRAYRTPLGTQATVDKEIDEMLRLGVIRPSVSPWSAPIVLIKKKNGEIRFCIDFRRLNAVTVPDRYPMPNINELHDRLRGARIFTTLDVRKGYWHVPMEPADTHKTAFSAAGNHFEFLRMPFGLRNSGATFQRMMDTVLRGIPGVLVYIDDILIFSETMQEHLQTLRQVLERLRQHKITLSKDKCAFGKHSAEYLGHVVSEQGVHIKNDNAEAIAKYPQPKTLAELERFLGILAYYNKFVKHLASRVDPLFGLRKRLRATKPARTNIGSLWTADAQKAFDDIRTALTQAPVLIPPDPKKVYYLSTDASGTGVGAQLEQEDNNGQRRTISFASRTLSATERKRATIDREATAIMWALDRWDHYLFGAQFIVETDHEPLRWIFKSGAQKGRLAHWFLRLQRYPELLDIVHKPGKLNVVPDALSRAPLGTTGESETTATIDRRSWLAEQETEPIPAGCLTISDGIWHHNGRIYLPPQLRRTAVEDIHSKPGGAHLNANRTLEILQRSTSWPGMAADVREFVRQCHGCQLARAPRATSVPYKELPDPGMPNHTLAVDFTGPLPAVNGRKYIFVAIDTHSRRAYAYPTAGQRASDVIYGVRRLLQDVPTTQHIVRAQPASIHSDRGRGFVSHDTQRFLRQRNIQHTFSAPFRPESNAFVERLIRTLKEALRAAAVDRDISTSWPQELQTILKLYNTTRHSSTGVSPESIHQRTTPSYADVVKRSAEARAASRVSRQQTKRQPAPFQIGQKVMRILRAAPTHGQGSYLRPRWQGPYIVIRSSGHQYLLRPQHERAHRVWAHQDDLRRFYEAGATDPQHAPMARAPQGGGV